MKAIVTNLASSSAHGLDPNQERLRLPGLADYELAFLNRLNVSGVMPK